MTRTADGFQTILDDAREASIVLARATTTHKNAALESIAAALVANTDRIVEALDARGHAN